LKTIKFRKTKIAKNTAVFKIFCQKFAINWTTTCQFFVKHLPTLALIVIASVTAVPGCQTTLMQIAGFFSTQYENA